MGVELAEGLKSSMDSSKGFTSEFLLDLIRMLFLGVLFLCRKLGLNCRVLFDHIAEPSVFVDVVSSCCRDL